MRSIPKLADAICETFAMALEKWAPADGVTYCNEAVKTVCNKMGYEKFNGLMANGIIEAMRTGKDWAECDANAAQMYANEGALVIAGWENQNGHGHVAVVRPGQCYFSNSWGTLAPKLMNVGEKNFIDLPASYAFSKDHRPTFYVLLP